MLQQAYLKAFLAWPSFRGESSFATWLHRIVHTTCLDHLRSTGRRERLAQRAVSTASVGDPSERVVAGVLLDAALQALPVDQRVVLLLVDGQGLGYDDAAEVLGVAPGTIASRLSRARTSVRAHLARGGE